MSYPVTKAALQLLAKDQGVVAHPWMHDLERINGLWVESERYEGHMNLELIEECLAKLDLKELTELICGDEENWPPILDKLSSDEDEQLMVCAFLEEAFMATLEGVNGKT